MNQTAVHLWEKVLEQIREAIGPQKFQLWFLATSLIDVDERTAVIGVPNVFTRDWLERRFTGEVSRALETALGRSVDVSFRIDAELYRNRRSEIAKATPTKSSVAPVAATCSGKPSHTLSSFVVGACNELAYRAVCRVVEDIGTFYNPLFIHGASGLGKTHLLRGMEHALSVRRGTRTRYVSGESFTNQFVQGARTGNVALFRKRFRSVDVLVIDDLDFLSNKHGTQEELLHTFNALTHMSRQIVVASNAHPREIPEFNGSLVNRFVGGLVVRIDPPDYQTRLAILKDKALARRIKLDKRVADYIAAHLSGSVREIEGGLNSVANLLAVGVDPGDIKRITEALGPLVGSVPDKVSAEMVCKAVCEFFSVTAKDIRSGSKARSIAYPRQLCMYLTRAMTDASYHEIAAAFGSRNHTTAMSACRTVKSKAENAPEVQRHLALLRAKIKLARRP